MNRTLVIVLIAIATHAATMWAQVLTNYADVAEQSDMILIGDYAGTLKTSQWVHLTRQADPQKDHYWIQDETCMFSISTILKGNHTGAVVVVEHEFAHVDSDWLQATSSAAKGDNPTAANERKRFIAWLGCGGHVGTPITDPEHDSYLLFLYWRPDGEGSWRPVSGRTGIVALPKLTKQ